MTHFLVLLLFAALVGTVFGVIGKDGRREQTRYGLSVCLKFVGVALALGWLLYFLPL